jgi:hypothetical protein
MITAIANRFVETNPQKAARLQREGTFFDVIEKTVAIVRKAYRDANPHISDDDINGLRMLDEMIADDVLAILTDGK